MLTTILIALIRVYQRTLSRLLLAAFGPVCRFEPSCSRYAVACLEGQGAVRGTLLSVRRLCKCHPFHPGGYDPPPPPRRAAGQGRAHQSPQPDGPPHQDAEASGLPPQVTMGAPPPNPQAQPVTMGRPPNPPPPAPAAAPATPGFSTTTRPETAA